MACFVAETCKTTEFSASQDLSANKTVTFLSRTRKHFYDFPRDWNYLIFNLERSLHHSAKKEIVTVENNG